MSQHTYYLDKAIDVLPIWKAIYRPEPSVRPDEYVAGLVTATGVKTHFGLYDNELLTEVAQLQFFKSGRIYLIESEEDEEKLECTLLGLELILDRRTKSVVVKHVPDWLAYPMLSAVHSLAMSTRDEPLAQDCPSVNRHLGFLAMVTDQIVVDEETGYKFVGIGDYVFTVDDGIIQVSHSDEFGGAEMVSRELTNPFCTDEWEIICDQYLYHVHKGAYSDFNDMVYTTVANLPK